MISDEDKEQIEHALEVNALTIVEAHMQHYFKVMYAENVKLLAIVKVAENLSKHIYIIYGDKNPVHISPTRVLNEELKEALKAWKETNNIRQGN